MQQPDKQRKLSLIRQLLNGHIDMAALRPAQTYIVDLREDGLYYLHNGRNRVKCAMNTQQYEVWRAANVREQDLILLTELMDYTSDIDLETVIPEPVPEPMKEKEDKQPLKAIKKLFKATSKKMEAVTQQKEIKEPQPKRAGKLSQYGLTWSCDPMSIEKDLFRQPGDYNRSYQIS